MPTTRETAKQEVARIKALKPAWSAGRVLSALGHPGYSDRFASAVIARIERTGCEVFAAKSYVFNETNGR